jgi:hypothetical protein
MSLCSINNGVQEYFTSNSLGVSWMIFRSAFYVTGLHRIMMMVIMMMMMIIIIIIIIII